MLLTSRGTRRLVADARADRQRLRARERRRHAERRRLRLRGMRGHAGLHLRGGRRRGGDRPRRERRADPLRRRARRRDRQSHGHRAGRRAASACKPSSRELGGRENQFTIGVAYDESDVEFAASTELGALDATRLAVPGGVFVGEAFTRLDASTANTGFYVSEHVLARRRASR